MIRRVEFHYKEGTTEEWEDKNPVLQAGEPGYDSDIKGFKLGDGVSRWTELDYFLTGGSGGDGSAMVALMQHINSDTPHSVYDNGPSLALLYANAKV